MITVDEYLGRIIEKYTAKEYSPELIKARKEYFDFIGPVHEEDPFFEAYMTAFIEWYVFDRDMTQKDLPPVRLYYRENLKHFTDEEQKIFNDLTKSRHSIFMVKKVTPSLLLLHDLFEDEKIKIEDNFPTVGFNLNDIFEAILAPFKGEWAFAKTFFTYPPEATKFITKEMKKIRPLEQKILLKTILRLRRLKLKCDRYPYVSPTQIYTLEEFNRNA